MSRYAPIYFRRVGKTKTGRSLFKLCHTPDGRVFGQAFCIQPETPRTARRRAKR